MAHARQIYSISLGCTTDSVRIQSVQPLFVAGQCLYKPHEQKLLVDILKGIEQDLGWDTEYRVQKLLEDWIVTN